MDGIDRLLELRFRGSLIFSTVFEIASISIVVMLAAFVPTVGSRYFSIGEKALRRLARYRFLSIGVSGALALTLAIGTSLSIRIPEPKIHDEFSYLLAADTFARGRVTNPTHPLWIYFESMHIIHQPSYASKYPPGQGLVMALGQIIGGHPIVGVWLSASLAAAALCWMLFAWLPPHWALLGGILAALHPTLLGWSQNYWGGAVATVGGALLLGGFRRVVSKPRARDAFLMTVGVIVLGNSRPYEGLMLAVLPIGYLLVWMARDCRPALPVLLTQVVLPILAVTMVGALAMGYYNSRVTGNALRMPYQVHEATYAVWPTFIFQKPNHNVRPYNHPEIARLQLKDRSLHSFKELGSLFIWKAATLVKAYFRPLILALPLLMIPWMMRRDWWVRFATLHSALFVAGLFAVVASFTHYGAPAIGLLFFLILQGMRYMRLFQWRGRPTGRFLVRSIIFLWVTSLFTTYVYLSSVGASKGESWALERAQMLNQLQSQTGNHLVIVRYKPDHNPHHEWVYNSADIDGARVVWAREMSSVHELLSYFKDRQVWLLEADANPPKLVPYSAG